MPDPIMDHGGSADKEKENNSEEKDIAGEKSGNNGEEEKGEKCKNPLFD